jgi:polysaccharide biosynthesis protein PslH
VRLLFLAPFAPRLQASHGGGRVIAELLDRLARRHEVALLCVRGAQEPAVDEQLRGRCVLVEEFVRCGRIGPLAPRAQQRANDALLRLRGRPDRVIQHAMRALHARATALARSWHPDLVQFEYSVMGQYVSAFRRCRAPRVLNEHEPAGLAAQSLSDPVGALGRVRQYLDQHAWRRYERAVIRRVDAVVAFTEADRHTMSRYRLPTPIVCIPFGTVVPEQPLNPVGQLPPSVLFVGSFIHPPNVDAALRLIRGIFPLVRREFPEAVLHIVGDRLPREVSEAAGPGVVLTGFVPDLRPYLDRAAVVVAPLRVGGGMRVKVVEALAAGKAVVASGRAISGLSISDGEQVLLAETDHEFGDAVVRLLRDPERRAALAHRAHAWACAHLGWDESISAYERLYESLVSKSQR